MEARDLLAGWRDAELLSTAGLQRDIEQKKRNHEAMVRNRMQRNEEMRERVEQKQQELRRSRTTSRLLSSRRRLRAACWTTWSTGSNRSLNGFSSLALRQVKIR